MKKLFIMLLMLTSCEFTPDEVFFKDISIPPLNNDINAIVDLQDIPEGDTIFCYTPILVRSQLRRPSQKIYKTEIWYNSVKISEGNEIAINPHQAPFSPGTGALTFRYFLSSGSGSVADLLNAEAVVLTKSWWLKIDFRTADPIAIQKLNIRDGVPYLQYVPSNLPNVTKMTLRYKSSLFPDLLIEQPINDFNAQEIALPLYCGDSLEASIDVQTNNTNTTTGLPFKTFVKALDWQVTSTATSHHVQWQKPTFYANIGEVRLTTDFDYFLGTSPGNANGEGTVTFYDVFGSYPSAKITIFCSNAYLVGAPPTAVKTLKLPIPKGNHFPAFDKMTYHKPSNSYYAVNGDELLCINANTHQVTGRSKPFEAFYQRGFGIVSSSNGKYLMLYRNIDYYTTGFWNLTPGTTQVGQQVHTISNVRSDYLELHKISNNGFLEYYAPDNNGQNGRTVIYDLENKKELYREPRTFTLLSDDGRYICDYTKVYKLSNGAYEMLPGTDVWDFSQPSFPVFSFIGNKIMMIKETSASIFEFEDGTVKEEGSFLLNADRNDFRMYYDAEHNLAAFMVHDPSRPSVEQTQMALYNCSTGAKAGSVAINQGFGNVIGSPYYYFNRHLYAGGESNLKITGAYTKIF